MTVAPEEPVEGSSPKISPLTAFLIAVLLGFIATSALPTQADDNAIYVPPSGGPPPVAPPLRKGSPLDHLANDPKLEVPTIGYREGHTSGSVYWIAHRLIDTDGGQGWGWVRKSDEGWNSAKWIALQETLGVAVAPHRKLVKADADLNYEYKFWGNFATYKAYDPHLDEMLPVFVLQGYEVLGPAAALDLKVGPPNRVQHRPSGASSRPSSPILSDPGVD
jgi:hypothetical protein